MPMPPRPAICQLPASARSSWSSNYALLETGADTVCRSKELAHDALLNPHIDPTDHVVNMLIEESSSTVVMLTQQPCCSAVMPRHCRVRWCGTASELSYVAHSLP